MQGLTSRRLSLECYTVSVHSHMGTANVRSYNRVRKVIQVIKGASKFQYSRIAVNSMLVKVVTST